MTDLFPSISILIPELKSGSQSAWTQLFDQFRAGLISKTRFLLNTSSLRNQYTPDDLVQEIYLKAWRQHETFRGNTTSQFAAWLLAILKNTFTDYCRAQSPEISCPTWFGFCDQGETPSACAISDEQEAKLHACLVEMDAKFREVLVLRHFEGLRFREIAERTGININTVVGLYRRGLSMLTEIMKQRKCEPRSGAVAPVEQKTVPTAKDKSGMQ